MLLVDANVLLNAENASAREHQVARGWLSGAFRRPEAVAFAWTVLLAFLRLSTHPAVFPRPLTPEKAVAALEPLIQAPQAVILEPTRRHLSLLRGLLASSGTAGNLVGDAHLAALALEHGATVISFDRDFGRFSGVRWRPPTI